jgi:hypothetical protein
MSIKSATGRASEDFGLEDLALEDFALEDFALEDFALEDLALEDLALCVVRRAEAVIIWRPFGRGLSGS